MQHCRLAKKFESLVATDSRFEVIGKVTLGLVCLRLKVSVKHVLFYARQSFLNCNKQSNRDLFVKSIDEFDVRPIKEMR